MPIQKLIYKPGVNREVTPQSNEGSWYDLDKVRFVNGYPESIGGWRRISDDTFLGICRSLWSWSTLGGQVLTGVGTNLKFYVESGGYYYDVTPIRTTRNLTNPFSTTSGSNIVEVTDAADDFIDGDFVTFSGATAVGGLTIDGEYQITVSGTGTYTIEVSSNATSTTTGGGTVSAEYQISVGPAEVVSLSGWGAGAWSQGSWGGGDVSSTDALRLWSQSNFGQDLIFGPRGGGIYYWASGTGVSARAVDVADMAGASDVPVIQNKVLVSDINRFVFCFGTNNLGETDMDPMLVRWSDQENAVMWTPSATNQAGDLRLSRGSQIVTAVVARQEILVWTDTALYSMQYVGAPAVWSAQLVGEQISIASPNSVAYLNGVTYWIGRDKFYMYDGRVQTLPCSLRGMVFNNICQNNIIQVFAGTVTRFNEVWWFYCVPGETAITRYVVYNTADNAWYYGTMSRSAWLDAGLDIYPRAATYGNLLVNHEYGVNDEETVYATAIHSYAVTSPVDIDDGDRFSFVRRLLPDISFERSTSPDPSATITLIPLKFPGSGYSSPESVGGISSDQVTRTQTLPVEKFDNQLYTRVRGRSLVLRIESNRIGTAWKLGSPQIDIRPDGRK